MLEQAAQQRHDDDLTKPCDDSAERQPGENVAGVMRADIDAVNAMNTATIVAARPSQRSTKNSPTATAPTTVAWSLGNEKSVVLSTRTWTLASVSYGRARSTMLPMI